MIIYINNHTFHYEVENLTRLFFPNTKLEVVKDIPETLVPPYVYTALAENDNSVEITVDVNIDEYHKRSEKTFSADNDNLELEMALMLFEHFTKLTDVTPPWGVLTGVRPIKLFRRLAKENDFDYAVDYFINKFKVSEEKTALTIETEKNERAILELSQDNSYSLYISIPFCPSRCSYCSFVSASVERTKHLVEPYVELLCNELKATAEYAKRLNLRLESVYMGGGTPTTLSAEQMRKVLTTVNEHFDLSDCREFTVEAGRPDTITEDKLKAISECGVDRISINPQTLNDEVLKNIGRRHTAQQVISTFDLAHKYNFNHINMDLIVGLPGDTFESFKSTLDKITELSPESITVHTLSMKRASTLTMNGKTLDKQEAETTAKMLSYANKKLHENKYYPYYLYRQSRMVGNMENTGWSKGGKEGIYNVFIMDETHTILACGAGAVSKLKDSKTDSLERIFNYKYPYEYINSFEEILKRKERIESFYADHS